MVLHEDMLKKYARRLLISRMRILCNHGFFGLLLMHTDFYINDGLETAATDGRNIIFNPDFLNSLSESELDFIMMHEILHMALAHCSRKNNRDHELFNIACDIVVNSNILRTNNMNIASITIGQYGESMHLTPDGREGYNYTAEQVYEMLNSSSKTVLQYYKNKSCDTHELWSADTDIEEEWNKWVSDAYETIIIRKRGSSSEIPALIERKLENLRTIKTDWRDLLNAFIQEDITDYSFLPPDHRFNDNPFFLPDYNEKEYVVKDILFMVDTSGSISNSLLTEVYSEINGAMEQFNGKLRGWLGFFDSRVLSVQKFDNLEDLRKIKPIGGGGTNFKCIFEYVNTRFQKDDLKEIIILTDGFAAFPEEDAAKGIPVLWVITNKQIKPPWGKICRITERTMTDPNYPKIQFGNGH